MFVWFSRVRPRKEQIGIHHWFEQPTPTSLNPYLERAWKQIEDVHEVTDPEYLTRWIPVFSESQKVKLGRECVRVVEDSSMHAMGEYVSSRRTDDEKFDGPRMILNPDKADLVGTIIHECWHLIEREILNSHRDLSPGAAIRFYKTLGFIHKTRSFKKCQAHAVRVRALSDQLKERAKSETIAQSELDDIEGAANFFEYLCRDDEWLARCYSQMIQNRAQRKGLSLGRKMEKIESCVPIYLESREAAKFDRTLQKLFKSMKWGSMPTTSPA